MQRGLKLGPEADLSVLLLLGFGMTGVYIRGTRKHACTRSGPLASQLPEFTTRAWDGDYCRKPKNPFSEKAAEEKVKSVHAGQGAESARGKDQQPNQLLRKVNSSQTHQHSLVTAAVFGRFECLVAGPLWRGGGLVKCSRTAAWRVPPQLIKNSDNMIYGTHFAHKITGCNCLPDVFCVCCFFLYASAGKRKRARGPENSGSLSRGVHASVSRADEGIKMCYISFICLYQPLGVHGRHKSTGVSCFYSFLTL